MTLFEPLSSLDVSDRVKLGAVKHPDEARILANIANESLVKTRLDDCAYAVDSRGDAAVSGMMNSGNQRYET